MPTEINFSLSKTVLDQQQSTLSGFLQDRLTQVNNEINNRLGSTGSFLVSGLNSAVNTLSAISGLLNTTGNYLVSFVNSVSGVVNSTINNSGSFLNELINTASGALQTNIQTTGSYLVTGLTDFVNTTSGALNTRLISTGSLLDIRLALLSGYLLNLDANIGLSNSSLSGQVANLASANAAISGTTVSLTSSLGLVQQNTGSYVTTGTSGFVKIQRLRALTDVNGVVNWTFSPGFFPTGKVPVIQCCVESSDLTSYYNTKVLAVNNTGVSVKVSREAVITILTSINVVAAPVNATGTYLHIFAAEGN